MVNNTGWCVLLLSSQANEKAFDKMFQMQIKPRARWDFSTRVCVRSWYCCSAKLSDNKAMKKHLVGCKCSLLIFQFCKFYWVMLPLFCICPFSVEALDKSSGNIYHCITSHSTDKAVHLFLPLLCSQGLQAFLRHPSAMCFCRNKKPQNSEFGFPLYFLFS